MSNFFRCLTGPRLYRLYKTEDREGREYTGNSIEHYSNGFVQTAVFTFNLIYNLTFYAFPAVGGIMYRRGYFSQEGVFALCRSIGISGVIVFFAMFLRGIGRLINGDYVAFISTLDSHKRNPSKNLKLQMSKYDFDFGEWPVDFRWNESTIVRSRPKIFIERPSRGNTTLDKLKTLPCSVLSFIAIHSFGRMMIYPGSVGLMNVILWNILSKGRAKLMEEHQAERFKLLSEDGNEIDSVFVDRRHNRNYPNGGILVICCEGNSGFYEFGITGTPIEAGYSVLGWNHPGFGFSTGTPFPSQELNAMDVVMHFAMSNLGFKQEDIVIYAWSIGGYSATWAAMNYPNIRGLVLDATFDDLVALAVARMPPSWKPLVIRTIRDYMDLNNAAQLEKYNGPVLLIRRSKDEIISTRASRSLETNRGNELLGRLLQNRYPKLFTNESLCAFRTWVAGDKAHQTRIASQHGVEEAMCEATLISYIEENGLEYPSYIGDDFDTQTKTQLLLYLAGKYMIDFDSTHCIPLPAAVFQLPWRIVFENEQSEDVAPGSHI